MNRVIAAALLAISLAAVAHDARAETVGPVLAQRRAAIQTANQLPAEVKQARVEMNGAKTFIINGRRVLVPADANAEAVIKALKARYPGLQTDAGAPRAVTAIEEK